MIGSPPHTWRILGFLMFAAALLRITSTHVENTFCGGDCNSVVKDHLHTRGEYLKVLVLWVDISGSPPHTWRIRQSLRFNGKISRDHLHTRGEYVFAKKL